MPLLDAKGDVGIDRAAHQPTERIGEIVPQAEYPGERRHGIRSTHRGAGVAILCAQELEQPADLGLLLALEPAPEQAVEFKSKNGKPRTIPL
nr:hypothetical protein [Pyrinomonadaceae bacterium]